MSRSETRRVVLADAALRGAALAEQLRLSNTCDDGLENRVTATQLSVVELAHEAVESALVDMGLAVERVTSSDGRVTFLGRSEDKEAEVVVDGDTVTATMDVPSDAVDRNRTEASDICLPSADLSLEFHTRLERESQRRGLPLGRIEALARPTRGAVPRSAMAARAASAARKAFG